MLTLDQLNDKSPSYIQLSEQWDFYYRSYMGNETYRSGEYLQMYWGENQAPFDAYARRLQSTPLDNHVRTTVDVYRSFLFRNAPNRTLGALADNPFVYEWMHDVDQDGQGLDSFMKTALDMAIVMGNVWLLVDKPNYAVDTQAQALEMGIRGYACMYTPQCVLDWNYTRMVNGKKELTYIKVIEDMGSDYHTIKCWHPDRIEKYTLAFEDGEYKEILEYTEYDNNLGYVPFVNMVPQKNNHQGCGNSLIGDVADMQKSIYNKLSELEQNIRLSNHPLLAKTAETQANPGAGGIITMPEDLPGDKNPFLLQPAGSSISGILSAIDNDVESINRMTHLQAVRAKAGSPMSGVALQTERQLLNSMLSDLADTVEETEYKLWKIWFDWQDIDPGPEFTLEYVKSFDLRDEHSDLELYRKALETVPHNEFQHQLHREIAKMIIDDEVVLNGILKEMAADHANGTVNSTGTSIG